MTEMSTMAQFALIGVGATVVMDLWALALRRLWGIPSLDYAMVGRWVLHMPKGVFAHKPIFAADPMGGERALGWFLHYAIGVVFAIVFGMVVGPAWILAPEPLSALLLGALTLVFPFFVMQPAFGAGIAASKTPAPNTARVRSLGAHLSFGVGVYLSGLLLTLL